MIESFPPERVKTVLTGILAGGFVLVYVARRLPNVAWLEPFRLRAFQQTEAQRARYRRFGNIKAGFEIMLAGIAVPMLYVLSRVFMFNEPTARGLLISGAVAVVAVVIGATILVRNR